MTLKVLFEGIAGIISYRDIALKQVELNEMWGESFVVKLWNTWGIGIKVDSWVTTYSGVLGISGWLRFHGWLLCELRSWKFENYGVQVETKYLVNEIY